MKKLWISIGAVAAAALLAPVVVPLLVPWTSINCVHEEISVRTGQARYTRYLWFVAVS